MCLRGALYKSVQLSMMLYQISLLSLVLFCSKRGFSVMFDGLWLEGDIIDIIA